MYISFIYKEFATVYYSKITLYVYIYIILNVKYGKRKTKIYGLLMKVFFCPKSTQICPTSGKKERALKIVFIMSLYWGPVGIKTNNLLIVKNLNVALKLSCPVSNSLWVRDVLNKHKYENSWILFEYVFSCACNSGNWRLGHSVRPSFQMFPM